MKTLIKILLFTSVFLLVLFSCKKEQLEMKKTSDPCECASEVSADFVIEELADPFPVPLWIETDTTLHGATVQFRSLEEDAEYTWYIGLDKFETKEASRYFSDQWIGYDIPITLVVKKEPNKICFPDDDGYDSITKSFYVSKYPIYNTAAEDIEHGGLEGTYRVFGNDLTDSIEVTINFREFVGVRTTDIGNPDGSGVICAPQDIAKGVRYWSYRTVKTKWFTDEDFCTSVGVTIHNQMDGISVLDFITSIPNTDGVAVKKEWQYKGRKIN